MKNLQRNALKLAIYENPTLKFFFTCYFILLYHTLKIYLPKNGNAGIHYYLATLFSYSFFFVRSWEKANFQGWMTFSRSSRSSYFVRNFESNYTLHRQKEVKSINWKKTCRGHVQTKILQYSLCIIFQLPNLFSHTSFMFYSRSH